MKTWGNLALFLTAVIVLAAVACPVYAAEQETTPMGSADLSVYANEIVLRNPQPFDGQYLKVESVQVRNEGHAPVLCSILQGVDDGKPGVSAAEYWATLAYDKIQQSGSSFDQLRQMFADDGVYPPEEELFAGVTLLKQKGIVKEKMPLFYTKISASRSASFCKVRIIDAVSKDDLRTVKEFTIENDLAPSTSLVLSTKLESYKINASGKHTLSVVVDPAGLVADNEKSNNLAELELNVLPFYPDLVFLGPNRIYNKGPAPAICERFRTELGGISPYKAAFGNEPRGQALSYMLLFQAVKNAKKNGEDRFYLSDLRKLFEDFNVFERYYSDYNNSAESKEKVFALVTKTLVAYDYSNPYVRPKGDGFWTTSEFETENFCRFGDSSAQETVCDKPVAFNNDLVLDGSFVDVTGNPSAFSHVNCAQLEDADPSNDLLSIDSKDVFQNLGQFQTKISVKILMENKNCADVVNVYASTTGDEWGLIGAFDTYPSGVRSPVDATVSVGTLFSYVKFESRLCTIEKSSVKVIESNAGDPFTRLYDECGNGVGWSVPVSSFTGSFVPSDACSPKMVQHVHYLGGGVEGLNPNRKEIVYLMNPLPAGSSSELVIPDSVVAAAGVESEFFFTVKNTGEKAIDELSIELDLKSDWVALAPAKISFLNPGTERQISASINVPENAGAGKYLFIVNAKRAGIIVSSSQFVLNVRTQPASNTLLIIYSLVGLAAVGLILSLIFSAKSRRGKDTQKKPAPAVYSRQETAPKPKYIKPMPAASQDNAVHTHTQNAKPQTTSVKPLPKFYSRHKSFYSEMAREHLRDIRKGRQKEHHTHGI